MALAGVASSTTRATLGLLVSPVTLRNPAVLTKMITTLDQVSGGRAILGIGAGWAKEEHRQFGIEFGEGFGERLRWLGEALPVIRGMLDGTQPTASGDRFAITEVVNAPLPMQRHLPILIGGSGPKITLRLVAEHGDIWNLIGTPDEMAAKDAILVNHCKAIGRDHTEIERTVLIPQPLIRNSRTEAEQALRAVFAHNGRETITGADFIGTTSDVVDRCAPYVEMGCRHLIFQFLAPFDAQTMDRLITEVKPLLEALDDNSSIQADLTASA